MSEKTKKKRKKKNNEQQWMKIMGYALLAIEVIAAISFAGMLFWLNFLDTKYEIIAIVVMLLLSALVFATQIAGSKVVKWLGRVFAVLLAVILIIGDVYIYQAKMAMSKVTTDKKVDTISVYVLKDDSASTIADAKDYTFGCHATLDRDNINKYIASVNSTLGKSIATKDYNDFKALVQNLYDKKVGAIIINQAYVSTLEEEMPDFEQKTKIIANEYYTTTIQKPNISKDTLKDTFTVYISGNDECGDLNKVGRSDVNIVAVVNPKTKQVLLVTIPRDAFVNVYSLTSGVGKDKLTHAGNFGVDASMKTLSVLYDNWDIDYFVRLNFTGTEAIIDAIDGITVNSDVDFVTTEDTSDVEYHFTVGPNEMNGKKALAFCRERHSVQKGEFQRGLNQMAVIQAIIDKASSPAILYNYTKLLDSISEFFQTNLSDDDFASIVKLTMDGDPWNIQTYAISGTGTTGDSYFFNYTNLYMYDPDPASIKTAVTLMNKTKNGEIFNVSDYE